MDLKRPMRKRPSRAVAGPGESLHRDRSARRLALKVLYWLAVLVVSLVIVFLLVLFFESLDDSSVNGGVLLPSLFGL
jgi:hypothetical protein